MIREELLKLNQTLNWDAPSGPVRCNACAHLGVPTAGCYSSSLADFEEVLGPINGRRSSVRALILFQDPRPSEQNFSIAPPSKSTADLAESTHRYFAPSIVAWNELNLKNTEKSTRMTWPNEENGARFLRRFTSASGAWSYDGIVAYMLHQLKPVEAVVTNVAKCHFSKQAMNRAAVQCSTTKLRVEAAALRPNFVILFARGLRHAVAKVPGIPGSDSIMAVYHPAYRFGQGEKRRIQFESELVRCSDSLSSLGVNVDQFHAAFSHDFCEAQSPV